MKVDGDSGNNVLAVGLAEKGRKRRHEGGQACQRICHCAFQHTPPQGRVEPVTKPSSSRLDCVCHIVDSSCHCLAAKQPCQGAVVLRIVAVSRYRRGTRGQCRGRVEMLNAVGIVIGLGEMDSRSAFAIAVVLLTMARSALVGTDK